MPISVLPWASASRRLSFTRPSPPRASDASEDTYTWSCARPNCWNCCKREVLLSGEIWPRPLEMADRSRSDRAGHRWKEGNFLRPPPSSSSSLRDFCVRGMRSHAFEERRNLAVFRPALYKSRREGKEGGGWRSVFLLELETRAK